MKILVVSPPNFNKDDIVQQQNDKKVALDSAQQFIEKIHDGRLLIGYVTGATEYANPGLARY